LLLLFALLEGPASSAAPAWWDRVSGPVPAKTCTFNAFVSGNSGQKITDTVEVCSIQPSDNDAQICGSDDADVYITDVFTAPHADQDRTVSHMPGGCDLPSNSDQTTQRQTHLL